MKFDVFLYHMADLTNNDIVELYRPDIIRTFHLICNKSNYDSELRKDVLQDIYLKILSIDNRKLLSLHMNGQLYLYLYGLIHNTVISTNSDVYKKYIVYERNKTPIKEEN